VGDDAVIWTGLDTFEVSFDIPDGLFHVTLDIEGETRGFWDSETEVEGDNTRDASETDEETPTVVDAVGCIWGVGKDGALVGVNDDEGDESGSWKGNSDQRLGNLGKIKNLAYQSYRNPGQRRWRSSYDHGSEWKQTRRR